MGITTRGNRGTVPLQKIDGGGVSNIPSKVSTLYPMTV